MPNTSDGGIKGDPPDPSNANINTDALFISTPEAHSDKNVLILTGIDPDIQFFVHTDDDDEDTLNSPNSPIPTTPHPPKTTGTVSATTTAAVSTPAAHSAKNVLVSSKIDTDTKFFVHTEEDDDAPNSPNSPVPTTLHPPKTAGTVSATTAAMSTLPTNTQGKNVPISSQIKPVLTTIDQASPNSSNTSPPADSDRPNSNNRDNNYFLQLTPQ